MKNSLKSFQKKRNNESKLIGAFMITIVFLGTLTSLFFYFPVLYYIDPVLNLNTDNYLNLEHLKLKEIASIGIKKGDRLGFITLEVTWPIWSDCGSIAIEIVKYDLLRKEIHIWIWGFISLCPQVVAFENYAIILFIPLLGSWEIVCNNRSIRFSV